MRNFIISIFVFFTFFLASFYLAPFFIPEKVELEPQARIVRIDNPKLQKEKKEPIYLNGFERIRTELLLSKEDFLEANLDEMKMKVYEGGLLAQEFPIFTKGDPERWGGTSLGLYEILSKYKVAYSGLADSSMPWSMKIYGKYYIHGDNWYSGGRPETLPITGGCLRLRDENAEALYNLTEIGNPILVTDKGLENDEYKYPSNNVEELPELSAKSYLIADLDSGFVFAEKNYQELSPIASITKLMTATIIAEIVDLRKLVWITPEMVKPPKETEGLVAGRSFRAFELFYPLLIESSNDAAEALGYFLGKTWTIQLMNEKAKNLQMFNTEFADLSGLDPQNVSTAEDLFYFTRYILSSRPMFFNISRGEEVWTFGLQSRFEDLENENIFFEEDNFIGGKTGYIQASQSTGVFIFRFPLENGLERRVAFILLGSEAVSGYPVNLEQDVRIALDWLKESYF